MENYLSLIVIGSTIGLCFIISWIVEIYSNSKKYLVLKPRLDNLEHSIATHNEQIKREREDIDKIIKQKSMGFPWLAEAIADYHSLIDTERETYLKRKSHPALTAAETVHEIKNEKKELQKAIKITSYKINYYEKLFPWLTEIIAADEAEEIPVQMNDSDTKENINEDRAAKFLTPEEYKKLPSIEKNQKALDRYLENRNKSKWQIGRDYEMYIGYLYQENGYSIEYKGIIDGFDDLVP
jgi:hypothetical protein